MTGFLQIVPLNVELPEVFDQKPSQIRRWYNDRGEGGKCRNPFPVGRGDLLDVMVPCGNCLPCRRGKRQERTGRAVSEAAIYTNSRFVTLTFDDHHLPKITELSKDWLDSQYRAYKKRVTRREPGTKFQFVAQLGTKTGRLHFHTLEYPRHGQGYPVADRKTWIETDAIWPYGHRIVMPVTSGTAGYVNRYLTDPGKGTIFARQSQKIGEQYFRAWCETPREKIPPFMRGIRGSYNVGDKPYPMGRRFREIAQEEYGLDVSGTEKMLWLPWLKEDGPLIRNIEARLDRQIFNERARQERMREELHPQYARAIDLIRRNQPRGRQLSAPGENYERSNPLLSPVP